jgi:hypothetical protein
MSSFTTMFRVVVMLAVGAGLFKGWQLYGPSAEEVKSALVRATEIAESIWKNGQAAEDEKRPPLDSLKSAPPFAFAPSALTGTRAMPPATLSPATAASATTDVPTAPALTNPPPIGPPAEKMQPAPAATNGNESRLKELLSRLEQLGGAEPKLTSWGSTGRLYRFSCRAALNRSPALTQHFESVAAEPAIAVEQVVAKVEAWRMAQEKLASLR